MGNSLDRKQDSALTAQPDQPDQMVAHFFGVRGTLPVPGKFTTRYGGNTSCVMLTVPPNHMFIFDAGTGIKILSDFLLREHISPIRGRIFITHPHLDHINGFPFFAPLYKEGNRFDVYGPSHHDLSIRELIGKQMDSVYFPVTMKEFAAHIDFHRMSDGVYDIDGVCVRAHTLSHPGHCLGYRIEYADKVFCYITDNELFLESSPRYHAYEVKRLASFIDHADMLVIDTTYTDQEYLQKVGWGHSCVSQVVKLAHHANAKLLCLFHHDPSQVDKDIDGKVKLARKLLKDYRSKTHCVAPHEGDTIIV